MIRKVIILTLITSLFGCTAYIREKTFITQDKMVSTISDSDINAWQREFPDYSFTLLKLPSTDQKTTMVGLYLDNKKSNDIIYYIPGNGMKISDGGLKALKELSALEQDIVIFDRRGLGATDGTASVQGLINDSLQQFDFIRSKMNPDRLIVHGFSLGGFVAVQVAKNKSIDALVLQGTATNASEWVDERFPWYYKLFVTVKIDAEIQALDNTKVLENTYAGPLLMITGEDDEQVPASLPKTLFQKSSSELKQLVVVENAKHSEMLRSASALESYRQFIKLLHSKNVSARQNMKS